MVLNIGEKNMFKRVIIWRIKTDLMKQIINTIKEFVMSINNESVMEQKDQKGNSNSSYSYTVNYSATGLSSVNMYVPIETYNVLEAKYQECVKEKELLQKRLNEIFDTDLKILKDEMRELRNEFDKLREDINLKSAKHKLNEYPYVRDQ
jgi:hypothetical protein